MHHKWLKAVGAVAVVVLCILDATQSSPVAPKRSLDSTEMYYLANDSDDATSLYKPLEKKAKTSSGAVIAKPQQPRRPSLDLNKVPSTHSLDTTAMYYGTHGDDAISAYKHPEKEATPSSRPGGVQSQQVGSPSSSSMSSIPQSSRQSTSDASKSSSWNEKQSEASTSDTSWQVSRRPRSSKAQKSTRGVGEVSSSLNTNALQTTPYDRKGHKFPTTAPGQLWDEGPEVMGKYSKKGVVKAKALAIQQHVPEYPMTPEEYPMVPPRRETKRRQTPSIKRFLAHSNHVRTTYARMARNQVKGLPLLQDVSLPVGQGDTREARLKAMQRRPPLPTGTALQDYRTLLSDSDIREPLLGAPRKGQQGQRRALQRAHEGRMRGAVTLKEETDAKLFRKAVKIHELDRSFPLLPQNYHYQPTMPMNSDEYKARQRENWSVTANRYYKKLGLGTSSLIHPPPTHRDSRGISSSWGAKRKKSHRRRGGL